MTTKYSTPSLILLVENMQGSYPFHCRFHLQFSEDGHGGMCLIPLDLLTIRCCYPSIEWWQSVFPPLELFVIALTNTMWGKWACHIKGNTASTCFSLSLSLSALAFGTQPPCCEEAQTQGNTLKTPNRPPQLRFQLTANINHQTSLQSRYLQGFLWSWEFPLCW